MAEPMLGAQQWQRHHATLQAVVQAHAGQTPTPSSTARDEVGAVSYEHCETHDEDATNGCWKCAVLLLNL